MNKSIDISVLLDIYGKLLSNVQYDSLNLYYNDDLSLSEIAVNFGKTRQSVFDTIKRAENALFEFESKLNFLKKSEHLEDQIEKIKLLAKSIKSKTECENSKVADKFVISGLAEDILNVTNDINF